MRRFMKCHYLTVLVTHNWSALTTHNSQWKKNEAILF